MTERGILFGDKWVRALREGRKTQTRRPIDPRRCTGWEELEYLASICPLGVPGDRLYTRECWGYDRAGKVHYRADGGRKRVDRWRPSRYMPRSLSRDLLEITLVRVEPVSYISSWDVRAEGCIITPGISAKQVFRAEWEPVYGADYPWDTTWVWAISFKRLKQQRTSKRVKPPL